MPIEMNGVSSGSVGESKQEVKFEMNTNPDSSCASEFNTHAGLHVISKWFRDLEKENDKAPIHGALESKSNECESGKEFRPKRTSDEMLQDEKNEPDRFIFPWLERLKLESQLRSKVAHEENTTSGDKPGRKTHVSSSLLGYLKTVSQMSAEVMPEKNTLDGDELSGTHKPLQPPPAEYPEDAVITMSEYQWQALSVDPSQKAYVDVFVCEFKNPGNFFIQLCEMSSKLDALMCQLNLVYQNSFLAKNYVMQSHLIRKNQVCVALFDTDKWYRAIIMCVLEQEMVEVLCVDDGKLGKVHLGKIRLLKKQFMDLPCQAILSKLARIRPAIEISKGSHECVGDENEPQWPLSAIERFSQLCNDRPLAALAAYQNDRLSLYLCDTTGEVDVHINATLVSEGHAFFEDDGNQIQNQSRTMVNSEVSLDSLSLSDKFTKSVSPPTKMLQLVRSVPYEEDCCIIKEIKFPEFDFHLVKMGHNEYVPTSELSTICGVTNMLIKQVKLACIPVNFFPVQKQARQISFEKLSRRCYIPAELNSIGTTIWLCPLNSIPDALFAAAPKRKDIRFAFAQLAEFCI